MASQNLRKYAIDLNINDDRYQWIIGEVEWAIVDFFSKGGNLDVYSSDCKIDIFALTLMNCCDRGDEGRFFCHAVESILREKHNSDEKSASNIASFIGQRCVQIADARTAIEQKQKSSGCLTSLIFAVMLPLGIYGALFIFS